jgi:chemotaxis protein histidine kinase CheA
VDTGRYAKLFLSESRESLIEINSALLELERGGGDAAVARLFRAFHTMKGMGAAMGYTSVAELSHDVQSLAHAPARQYCPIGHWLLKLQAPLPLEPIPVVTPPREHPRIE